MITILHRGGQAKWLQYYIGGGSGQMITILHREGGVYQDPKSDYVIYGWPLRAPVGANKANIGWKFESWDNDKDQEDGDDDGWEEGVGGRGPIVNIGGRVINDSALASCAKEKLSSSTSSSSISSSS